jgi:hypothetical protein
VAHKGFLKRQNVVDAIEEICMPRQRGVELDHRQKEAFLEFIRGENGNSHHEFCTFWFTTLALSECAGYIWQELSEELYISFHIYHFFLLNSPSLHPLSGMYILLVAVGFRNTSLLRM